MSKKDWKGVWGAAGKSYTKRIWLEPERAIQAEISQEGTLQHMRWVSRVYLLEFGNINRQLAALWVSSTHMRLGALRRMTDEVLLRVEPLVRLGVTPSEQLLRDFK